MLGSRAVYFLCMVAATIVASWLLRRRQQRLKISSVQKFGIVIGGLVGATFAAKLPFALTADPNAGVLAAWLSDGKTILWGLTGGYIGVEVAKWALHVTASTGDSFVVPVAITVAIGRVGCFLYGCCYGVATNQTWGFRFPIAPDAGAILRHPTQLYELLFHLSFAAIEVETYFSGTLICCRTSSKIQYFLAPGSSFAHFQSNFHSDLND